MVSDHLMGWSGRILIALVLLLNLQCTLAFIVAPDAYAPAFEMSGVVGAGMVRGMGILFLMWNVPYAAAAVDPVRRRFSLFEAVVMQAIALVGETLLHRSLPIGHMQLQATIARFILFDGFGLLALLLAAWLTNQARKHLSP